MPDKSSRILVVDDDFATRLLASEALLADGFEPLDAENGNEALELFARSAPDAVLLDVHMPGLDGYEVCRRLRQRPGGAAIPVMMMTATDDLDAVTRAFAAGATDFLTKPLNLPLLSHRVRFMLRAAADATTARDTAARLARAQRLARLVHWQLGSDEQVVWASDPFAVFWPDAPEAQLAGERPCHRDHLLTFVHPDDRDRVAGVLAARTAHQIEFRLQLPDGSERIVHQDAAVDFGEHGVVLIGATQDITELKRAERQIAQLAYYDDLTGIPNRPLVERYLRRADPSQPRAAIVIELGTGHHDRLSTAARDTLIRACTARVIERVRGADLELRLDQLHRPLEAMTGPVLVARTSTDELLVLTTTLGAAALACQLADVLAAPFAIAGADLVIRPRIGVAEYPDPIGDLRRLTDHARSAMQDAERTPPRNVVVLTAAARELRAHRAELVGRLAIALDLAELTTHPELAVEYVPRIEPVTRKKLGVRARPTWLPASAVQLAGALASEPRLADRLASWTLGVACRDCARWLAGGAHLRIAVELPHGVVTQPGFAERLRRQLADARCEPLLVDLELIDLPTAEEELEQLTGALAHVRALGVRIALACVDDRRSLGELRRLPLDGLRIDRSTIDRLGPGFVTTVAALAQALGLRLAVAKIDAPAALAALDACAPSELGGTLFGAAARAASMTALAGEPGEQSHQTSQPLEAAASWGSIEASIDA